jgi:hypothetical protein
MYDPLTNFKKWFKDPILRLQQDPDAGLITVMVSLALLERYVREKSGIPENESLNSRFHNSRFHKEFLRLFPSIGTEDAARKFWEACRHGLMHQATFKIEVKGGAKTTMGLHESAPEIECTIDSRGDAFIMISPRKFSSRVIQIIENDFATFEGLGSPKHPLSQISSAGGYSGYSGVKR